MGILRACLPAAGGPRKGSEVQAGWMMPGPLLANDGPAFLKELFGA
jgi:hypothetical protein